MSVESIIKKIDVRAQYKAYGLGDLPLTDSELNAQLANHINTAIMALVQGTDVDGAELNVKVVSGNVVVSLKVKGNSVNGIEALSAAVDEYLENEVAYLWWVENEPRYADNTMRELLKGVVKQRVAAFVEDTIPPKRNMKAKEVPVVKVEFDYE